MSASLSITLRASAWVRSRRSHASSSRTCLNRACPHQCRRTNPTRTLYRATLHIRPVRDRGLDHRRGCGRGQGLRLLGGVRNGEDGPYLELLPDGMENMPALLVAGSRPILSLPAAQGADLHPAGASRLGGRLPIRDRHRVAIASARTAAAAVAAPEAEARRAPFQTVVDRDPHRRGDPTPGRPSLGARADLSPRLGEGHPRNGKVHWTGDEVGTREQPLAPFRGRLAGRGRRSRRGDGGGIAHLV